MWPSPHVALLAKSLDAQYVNIRSLPLEGTLVPTIFYFNSLLHWEASSQYLLDKLMWYKSQGPTWEVGLCFSNNKPFIFKQQTIHAQEIFIQVVTNNSLKLFFFQMPSTSPNHNIRNIMLLLVTQPYTHVHWNMRVSICMAFLPSSCRARKLHVVEPWSLGAADFRFFKQANWWSFEYWVLVTQPYTHVHWNMNWHLSAVEKKVSIYVAYLSSSCRAYKLLVV